MGGGEVGLPYFCSLSSGVRGQWCWNYPPLLEILLLIFIQTHRVSQLDSSGDDICRKSQFPSGMWVPRGCPSSREWSYMLHTGSTKWTQCILNSKRRCKNVVGKLVVEGKTEEKRMGWVWSKYKTFCEGIFFFFTFGPMYLKYLDRHDDLLNKKTL